ncbi:MAG: hypothetical protein N3E50_10060 [Candidatus Goldbacteria bacterium]|nr:hypothetical protein [Candidatus Goldiibacteriota bacterium]
MAKKLNNEQEFLDFFDQLAEKCCLTEPDSIIIYHNQRKTVLKLLKQIAEKHNMGFIEQDLTLLTEEKIGTSIFENKVPEWLRPVFENKEKKSFIIYMREFAFASDRVKNDAMNLLQRKQIEGFPFPNNTLIVLGVVDVDGVTAALSNVQSVTFYRNIE